jgi:tetratricopeptide (TPR) repeat protein
MEVRVQIPSAISRRKPMVRACFIASLISMLAFTSACAQHDHGAAAGATGPPPLYNGLGTLRHKVTTKSPAAQKYFDQGLRLAFAFNHDEAGRAFREAARLDSSCAMAYWGQALVLGPNINMPMSEGAEMSAYALVRRAQYLAPKASEAERAIIEALVKRYDRVPGAYRAAHDSAYADAMRDLAKRYPDDLDAAVLCAEALMDLRPWDLWTLDGKPQPGTPEIVSILEGVLKRNPDHVGAIHYYIHAVEASPEPARAEPYADRLAKLTPYAGHLVHMPSHIYLRLGRYEDAQEINARAVAADRDYIKKQNVKGSYAVMYYPHNIQMRWSALCSQGRRADAIAAAKELAEAVPDSLIHEMPMAEFFLPSRYLTQVRFGLWDEILKEAAPPPGMPLRQAAWHYARGMALAAKGKAAEAAAERDSVGAIAGSMPAELYFSLNPAAAVFRFAEAHLTGEIAARSGRASEAIPLLKKAVGMQDSLRYDEPPPWNVTARQSLGVVYLAAGRAGEAEAVYRDDLARYPEEGWSLYGLTQALRAQNKTREAAAAEKRFRLAWAKSDVTLQASRY